MEQGSYTGGEIDVGKPRRAGAKGNTKGRGEVMEAKGKGKGKGREERRGLKRVEAMMKAFVLGSEVRCKRAQSGACGGAAARLMRRLI